MNWNVLIKCFGKEFFCFVWGIDEHWMALYGVWVKAIGGCWMGFDGA